LLLKQKVYALKQTCHIHGKYTALEAIFIYQLHD